MSTPRRQQPFWRHSLRLYAAPGVADACLALQDAHGVDVNLVLLCGWLGGQGRVIGVRAMRQAIAAVAAWQREVVQPLRAVRRALKLQCGGPSTAAAQALRQRVARLELDAEFEEHERLLRWAEGLGPVQRARPAQTATAANLRCLLGLQRVPAARVEAALAVLATAGAGTPGPANRRRRAAA